MCSWCMTKANKSCSMDRLQHCLAQLWSALVQGLPGGTVILLPPMLTMAAKNATGLLYTAREEAVLCQF